MMKKVAIVILNWRQPDLTINTVNSLLKIKHSNFYFHIYIIDNGSNDSSYNILKNHFSKSDLTTVLKTDSNLGFVGGNNYAIKKIKDKEYDFFLLINNDVLVKSNFLELLIDFNLKNKQYQILSPKIYFAPGMEYHKKRYLSKDLGKVIWSLGGKIDWDNIICSNYCIDEVDRGQYKNPITEIDFLSGCCLLIESTVIKNVGLFDPRYFMYLEDVDFCQKSIRKGFKIVCLPDSIIWHINSGSSAAGGNLHDYFLTRNRLIFGFKYAKLKTKLALIRESFKLIRFGSKWQKKGVVDFFLNNFSKGSWQ